MRRLMLYQEYLRPYRKILAEAALAAAIDYLFELGIRRIYYHDFETGCRLKGIELDWAPPRSLYTDLPKRFCMQRTEQGPSFLIWQRRVRKRLEQAQSPAFYLLDLESIH